MLTLQNDVAKQLGVLEELEQRSDEVRSRFQQFDPQGTISRLRDQEREQQHKTRMERESMIQEFRHTIKQMVSDFKGDYDAQATDYERKVKVLQKQLEHFTGGYFPDLTVMTMRRDGNPQPYYKTPGFLSSANSPDRPLPSRISSAGPSPDRARSIPLHASVPQPSASARDYPDMDEDENPVREHEERARGAASSQFPSQSVSHRPRSLDFDRRSNDGLRYDGEDAPPSGYGASAKSTTATPSHQGPQSTRRVVSPHDNNDIDFNETTRFTAANGTLIPQPKYSTARPSPASTPSQAAPVPAQTRQPSPKPTRPSSKQTSIPEADQSMERTNPIPVGTPNVLQRSSRPVSASGSNTLAVRAKLRQNMEVESLQQQLDKAQAELEEQRERQAQLQEYNAKLKERLQEFKRQNDENVEQAEKQLQELHEDLERTLQARNALQSQLELVQQERDNVANDKQHLEQLLSSVEASVHNSTVSNTDHPERVRLIQEELRSLKGQNVALEESLEEANREVQKAAAEAEFISRKAELYATELRALDEQVRNEEIAQGFYETRLLSRGLHLLHAATIISKDWRSRKLVSNEQGSLRCQRRYFRVWQLYTLRALASKSAAIRRMWAVTGRCFRAWVELSIYRRNKRTQKRVARHFNDYIIQARSLRAWHQWLHHFRYARADDEQQWVNLATAHDTHRLAQKAFFGWRLWLTHVVRPNRMRTLAVDLKAREHLVVRSWDAWKQRLAQRRMTHAARLLADGQYLRSLLRFWNMRVHERRLERAHYAVAEQRCDHAVQMRFFERWRTWVGRRQRSQRIKVKAYQIYFNRIKRRFFYAWRRVASLQIVASGKSISPDAELKRLAWFKWTSFVMFYNNTTRNAQRADQLRRMHLARCFRRSFLAWHRWIQSRRAERKICEDLEERRRLQLVQSALVEWRSQLSLVVRDTRNDLRRQCTELEARIDAEASRTANVDLEYVRLYDQIHVLNAELTNAQQSVQEHQDHNASLQSLLEESAVVENSLRADLERREARERDLKEEIRRLRDASNNNQEEATATAVQHMLDRQGLEQTIQQLRSHAEDQQTAAESAERRAQEAERRLEEVTLNSQDKLAAAFEIAASLRKLLEERDVHALHIARERDQNEAALSELQRKLSASNNANAQTLEQRDDRIHELQRSVARLQQQLSVTQSQLEEYEVRETDKDAQIRKLQYQVQFMEQREANKVDQFLHELQTSRSPPVSPQRDSSSVGLVTTTSPPRQHQASPLPHTLPLSTPAPAPAHLSTLRSELPHFSPNAVSLLLNTSSRDTSLIEDDLDKRIRALQQEQVLAQSSPGRLSVSDVGSANKSVKQGLDSPRRRSRSRIKQDMEPHTPAPVTPSTFATPPPSMNRPLSSYLPPSGGLSAFTTAFPNSPSTEDVRAEIFRLEKQIYGTASPNVGSAIT